MKEMMIICANDNMELAFPPGAEMKVVLQESDRIKAKYLKQYPPPYEGAPCKVYVHTHHVPLYGT